MKVSAPHRGWTSGRATPSLRPTPYAAKTANPAGRHLSFAEICPDDRGQLSAVTIADTLWWLDMAMAVVCGVSIPFLMFTRQDHSIEKMTAVWLLPIVAAEVT